MLVLYSTQNRSHQRTARCPWNDCSQRLRHCTLVENSTFKYKFNCCVQIVFYVNGQEHVLYLIFSHSQMLMYHIK